MPVPVYSADAASPPAYLPPPRRREPWPQVPEGQRPRKRKRVFMWCFIALQAVFLAWVITGISTANNAPSAAEVHKGCDNGAWVGLFQSHADCMTHYAAGLSQAGNAGTAIGVGIVIALWVACDVILGIGRLVVIFSRRGSHGA
jgi:hypothetical protein